jgi:hypothetical protein
MGDNFYELGEEMDNLYSEYRDSVVPIIDSTTVPDITRTANTYLDTLNISESAGNLVNNGLQQDIVLRDQLSKMENEDITNQLRNLNNIESNIENKSRLISQINDNMSNNDTNINVLIVSIIFSIIFLTTLILYGYTIVSKKIFYYSLYGLGIIYIFYVLYSYDIFYLKSALNKLFTRNFEKRLENTVQTWSKSIEDTLQKDLYGTKQDWVKNNCDCPTQELDEEGDQNVYPMIDDGSNTVFEETPGYFYYDGSTPQQLLIPTPDSRILNQNINWVDYSQNSSTNYYNYNADTNDPNMKLRDALNNSSTLIPNGPVFNANNVSGNKAITYSANF